MLFCAYVCWESEYAVGSILTTKKSVMSQQHFDFQKKILLFFSHTYSVPTSKSFIRKGVRYVNVYKQLVSSVQ